MSEIIDSSSDVTDPSFHLADFILTLARTLTAATSDHAETAIFATLPQLAEMLRAVRAVVVLRQSDMMATYQWQAGDSTQLQHLPADKWAWFLPHIARHGTILTADSLTDAECAVFEMQAGEQLVVAPLEMDDVLTGFIALKKSEADTQPFDTALLERACLLFAIAQARWQREAAQAQELWMLRTIMDNIPELVYVKDTETRFMYGNRALVLHTGLESSDELIGKDDSAYFEPEFAAAYRADDMAVIQSQQPLLNREEQSFNQFRGEFIWQSTNKFPLYDQQGRVIGLFGINHDITSRKLSEEKLAQQQHLMRVMIDHLPGSIFVKDTRSRFLLVNQPILRQMNLKSEEDVLGKTDFDFHPREFAEQYFADEQALIASGEPLINHEERVFDQTLGEMRWLSTSKIPVRDASGSITSIVGINYDITERKTAELAIRDTNEMLEQRVTERTAELSEAHEQLQREMQERREREAENALLQQQIIESQRLAIQELSTPIIPIVDEVIVMPVVGTVDTHRATDITRALLAGISQYRAKVVILDITGVAIVDTGVANYLNKTIQAARLKGARTIVTGISDSVAETVVDLGIEWHKFETLSNLQNGLRQALAHTGYTLLKQKSSEKAKG